MNKKNERVRKLWERGVRDPQVIARKLGYPEGAAGIERVYEALCKLKIADLPVPNPAANQPVVLGAMHFSGEDTP